MDAKRYQQIQDLFWEAEALTVDEREPFVTQQAQGDEELVQEVMSLLREHNFDAALSEGDSPQRVSLPAFEDELGAGRNLTATGNSPVSQPTVSGAQRTHASPRQTTSSRTAIPNQVPLQSSTIITSIGPKQSKWDWLPGWLLVFFFFFFPIWVTACWQGNRENERERVRSSQSLAIAVEFATLRAQEMIESCRAQAQELARRPELIAQISVESGTTTAGDQKPVPDADQLAPQPGYTAIVWNTELRSVSVLGSETGFASDGPLSVVGARVPSNLAGQVTRSLDGETTFIAPTFESRPPSPGQAEEWLPDPQRTAGWCVPIQDDSSSLSPGSSSASLMLMSRRLIPSMDKMLQSVSQRNGLDVYLVDRNGIMQSSSSLASKIARGLNVGGALRVSEPLIGDEEHLELHDPAFPSELANRPLTVAAATIVRTPDLYVHPLPYRSYWGANVLGAWKWWSIYDLGIVAERATNHGDSAFSSTWPLASLFTFIAAGVASCMTWWNHRRLQLTQRNRQPLGQYQVLSELGAGGMGMVYKARHLELGKLIALKVLRSDRQDNDDRQRFEREARLSATLSSPHSVTVYDYGYSDQGNAFFVMELLEGLTLSEVVARSGPQPAGRVIWILQQICQSVLEAHSKGLLHRDLKPQNVMLRCDPVIGDWVVVFDFGLVKPIEPKSGMFQTAETIWAGTPMYMAPERFRDPTSMDPRSDIYSIGCIAYYLLAGKPPFAECDPESMFALIMTERPIDMGTHLGSPIDPLLDAWVKQCMTKDRQSRSGSVAELTHTLEHLSHRYPWTREDAKQSWQKHGE